MRPSRDQMFMSMARAAASRATCFRLNVGAVCVSAERNVVGIGYNGSPAGRPHCTGRGCEYFTPSGCQVVHAEKNALDRVGPQSDFVDLYVTHSPCAQCAGLILSTRTGVSVYPWVRRVYFETAYRDPEPVKALGDDTYQILPSGMLVRCTTGELIGDDQ